MRGMEAFVLPLEAPPAGLGQGRGRRESKSRQERILLFVVVVSFLNQGRPL